MSAEAAPLWHVTLHVHGPPAQDAQLAKALRRLCDQDPGNMAARYAPTAAELQFWDEASDIDAVARSAIEWWQGVRGSGGLPEWALIGLDIAEVALWRAQRDHARPAIAPGSVAPRQ